jgi:hypothetical protein
MRSGVIADLFSSALNSEAPMKLAIPSATIVRVIVGFSLIRSLRPVREYGVNGYFISVSVSMIGQG